MILTCEHVVRGATAIWATMHDGRRLRARLIAADPRCDLAILQVSTGPVVTARLGSARAVRPGHLVMAFGPRALPDRDAVAPPLAWGIVTAMGRPLPTRLGANQDRYYGEMIETTAGVGPGFSGGPLIDIHGRVIGVIGVRGDSPGSCPSAYAIPMHEGTRRIVESLLAGRAIEYGYLGVEAGNAAATPRGASAPEQSTPAAGAVLRMVYPGGPADRAGLRAGDIIMTLGDRPIQSADELVRAIGEAGGDGDLEIGYWRDGQLAATSARAIARAQAIKDERAEPIALRGAWFAPMDEATSSGANLPRHAWLVVRVDADSPAGRAGLSPGDVVVRIDGAAAGPASAARLNDARGELLLGLAGGKSVILAPARSDSLRAAEAGDSP